MLPTIRSQSVRHPINTSCNIRPVGPQTTDFVLFFRIVLFRLQTTWACHCCSAFRYLSVYDLALLRSDV